MNASTEQLSYVIIVGFIGRMAGAVLAGSLPDTLPAELQLSMWTLGLSMVMLAVPWCPGTASLATAMAMGGVFIGSIGTCEYIRRIILTESWS